MIEISQVIYIPPSKHVQIRRIIQTIPGQTCMQDLDHTVPIYLVKHVQVTQIIQIPHGEPVQITQILQIPPGETCVYDLDHTDRTHPGKRVCKIYIIQDPTRANVCVISRSYI